MDTTLREEQMIGYPYIRLWNLIGLPVKALPTKKIQSCRLWAQCSDIPWKVSANALN